MLERFETYTTTEGDMVDAIAHARFGTSRLHAERILDANPGLAAAGEKLPAGVTIKIPVPEVQDRREARRLWD